MISVVVNAGTVVDGRYPRAWISAFVKTTSGNTTRLFVLKPSVDPSIRVAHGEQFIEGLFVVVQKINNGIAARDTWKQAKRKEVECDEARESHSGNNNGRAIAGKFESGRFAGDE